MPGIYSQVDYEMLKNQQALFSDFVDRLDPKWVYKSLRFKNFLEQCQKRNIQPILETHYNCLFSEILQEKQELHRLKPKAQETQVNEEILLRISQTVDLKV